MNNSPDQTRSRRRHSTSAGLFSRRSRRRGGFTLLEVMIATGVTLLMMVSLAKIFNIIGESMKQGRAVLELNNRLRSVTDRIRLDLDNLTAMPNPPANPASGSGYLKYYDGSLTDYTAGQYAATLGGTEDLSRFGDVDDVLMFTARARAGDAWFTGKVPLFVLQGAAPTTTNLSLVTIAAQHAEIAVFVEPVVSNVGNVSREPGFLFADPNNYETIIGTDMPARYRLHYRTLLIRPDLNLATSGTLPNGTVAGIDYLLAQPTFVDAGGSTVPLPSPTCDMITPHQQCDLSIRRVDPFSGTSAVAANSLDDLLNPANRFAHVQIPIPAEPNTLSMPILALSPKIDMTGTSLPYTLADAGRTTISNPPLPLEFQSGFLHPAFTLAGGRTGEDVIASDILAFDVKGYDPSVPQIISFGPDGGPGTAGVNDDGASGVDDSGEAGWAGTDDILLTPNNPGYGAALAGLSSAPPQSVVVGTGDYVDLAWGWKTRSQSLATVPAGSNTWGQLSGLSSPLTLASPFTEPLYKSGLIVHAGALTSGNPPLIFQPAYDTWNAGYEGDGILQAETAVTAGRRGTVRITNLTTAGPPLREAAWRGSPGSYLVDPATDGIDNNPPPVAFAGAGVDDISELETSPPFPVRLRGIKISVRMEDSATREVKQMSVAKEFVTQ